MGDVESTRCHGARRHAARLRGLLACDRITITCTMSDVLVTKASCIDRRELQK